MKFIKKNKLYRLLFVCLCLLLINCGTDTPEQYFNITVLNVNFLNGFANNGLSRELESPSVKLSGNGDETVTMKRSEVVDMKINTIETNFEKVKGLKETADTKDIINSSLELYKFVLPVYKTEYAQLAELYDNGTSNDQILLLSNSIHDKYYSRYKELYNKLISAGKLYAEKNSIKVNWGVD